MMQSSNSSGESKRGRKRSKRYMSKVLKMGGGMRWWSKGEGGEGRARRGAGWRTGMEEGRVGC